MAVASDFETSTGFVLLFDGRIECEKHLAMVFLSYPIDGLAFCPILGSQLRPSKRLSFTSRRTIYPPLSVEDPVFEGHWDGVDVFFSMCIQAAHEILATLLIVIEI